MSLGLCSDVFDAVFVIPPPPTVGETGNIVTSSIRKSVRPSVSVCIVTT